MPGGRSIGYKALGKHLEAAPTVSSSLHCYSCFGLPQRILNMKWVEPKRKLQWRLQAYQKKATPPKKKKKKTNIPNPKALKEAFQGFLALKELQRRLHIESVGLRVQDLGRGQDALLSVQGFRLLF